MKWNKTFVHTDYIQFAVGQMWSVHTGWITVLSLRTRARSLAIRHFWCEILSRNDESVHAVKIWRKKSWICTQTDWHLQFMACEYRTNCTSGKSSQIVFYERDNFTTKKRQHHSANSARIKAKIKRKRTHEAKRIKTSKLAVHCYNNHQHTIILATHLNWLQLNDHTRKDCASVVPVNWQHLHYEYIFALLSSMIGSLLSLSLFRIEYTSKSEQMCTLCLFTENNKMNAMTWRQNERWWQKNVELQQKSKRDNKIISV